MGKHIKEMVAWTFMGKGGLLPSLLFGAALAVSAAPAGAEVVTSTWIGGNPGDWSVAGNWSPSGVPKNTFSTQYNVVIDGPNEGPYLKSLSVAINALTISNSTGYVDIQDGGSLELKNSSGLSSQGTIKVQAGGMLLLNGGNATSEKIELIGISGTAKRATLRINSSTSLVAPVTATTIVGSDPDDTSGLPGGSAQTPDGLIDGDGKLTLPSSGTIKGELEVQVGLINNGLVDADNSGGKIYLTSTSKTGGSGANFKATAGLLQVNSAVTGSADWTSSGTGYLLINFGSTISGDDMNILKVGGNSGGLKVNSQVTLAGNLDVSVTDNSRWQWDAPCKFTGGTSGSPVTIEVAGEDVWCGPPAPAECPDHHSCVEPGQVCRAAGSAGDCWDLAWSYTSMGMGEEVILGNGAHLKAVDNHNNGNLNGFHCEEECFMVMTLTFEDSNGRYDLNGFDAHYCNTDATSGQIEGSPSCN